MANQNKTGNVVIGQSGGPTVVINQSLVGCIETLKRGKSFGRILGARHGVRGIINQELIDLTDLSTEKLERLATTPSAALGSSRDKPDEAYCQKILDAFAKNDVRTFFYIGGNDSADTCRIIRDLARSSGYELLAFHVPKTIDNDLVLNDHTPGYGSAARFVALAFQGDDLDNRSLPGIKINVVMGRNAGFLTAASVLARERDGDGPHLIYVPEVPFDPDAFVGDVDRVYRKLGRCLIAVSEGVHTADGTPIVTKLAGGLDQDAHGNVQLSGTGALGDFLAAHIKAKLGAKRVRADTFGYLQRSYPGTVSKIDQDEARAVGRKAVEAARQGEVTSGSITIERQSNRPYRVTYGVAELSEVAGKTRTLLPEHIAGTCDIAKSFRDYLLPLVGELPPVERLLA